eukprot:12903252-Prorocentrum_lima.AAC.1
MGHGTETLFRVCRIENDPLFEEPRNPGFSSRAIYHSDSAFCAEPTLPAHSHTRIMDPTVDYPRLVDQGISRPGAIP